MVIFCPPACLARSIIISMTEAAMKESNPLVGSSQNSSGGFVNTYGVSRKDDILFKSPNIVREKKNSQKFVNSKTSLLIINNTTQLD
jgi:hypothetical protein